MPDFYYQIKTRGDGGFSGWNWPPLYSGRVQGAKNKKEAATTLEEQYGVKLPQRVMQADEQTQFLLHLQEMGEDTPELNNRFLLRECKECGGPYTLQEKYLLGESGDRSCCSTSCANKSRPVYVAGEDRYPDGLPVIYRITNKETGKCYIGRTRQPVTLRWWQHVFQSGESQFHQEIKGSPLTAWFFEVIEVVAPDLLAEREQYWIDHYGSLWPNGYNSRQEVAVDRRESMTDEATAA